MTPESEWKRIALNNIKYKADNAKDKETELRLQIDELVEEISQLETSLIRCGVNSSREVDNGGGSSKHDADNEVTENNADNESRLKFENQRINLE
ncbi:16440_t:CDS:2 [Acaulospora colombiana]|uniref:16440_t:CDS:1 n=1 Tax=Acaulospora colombiana TaxID=27376 RepID=A0ACA9K583_9GLOM|nr:16440_t:CDS:2 [Acaulospora colombiana]